MNNLKVKVIKIKLIFFLFIKVINCNKVIVKMNTAILKLIINYFKILLVKSYINEDNITFNKLYVNFNSFNIINKIYVNSL